MSFNANPGETLLLPSTTNRKEHLYVVVIESVGNPKETIIVNLTTKRTTSDPTVILHKGDHSFIHHPTIIEYKFAKIVKTQALMDAVVSGRFQAHQAFNDDILSTIQDGLLKSCFTPNKVKNFFRSHHLY